MTMTRNLADTLGPERVRVNQLNVGWTLTENEYRTKIDDGLPPDWPDQLPHYAAPSGKLLLPEDIAEAALTLSACISVQAPDKPIVIELNINIKQEVIYRLSADAASTIEQNKDIF